MNQPAKRDDREFFSCCSIEIHWILPHHQLLESTHWGIGGHWGHGRPSLGVCILVNDPTATDNTLVIDPLGFPRFSIFFISEWKTLEEKQRWSNSGVSSLFWDLKLGPKIWWIIIFPQMAFQKLGLFQWGPLAGADATALAGRSQGEAGDRERKPEPQVA